MRRSGFTLIEVMITVAIVAIIAAFAIPNFMAYKRMSQRNTCVANMKMILNAQESYCAIHLHYCENIEDLCGYEGDKFLREMPKCPCDGTYKFVSQTSSSGPTVTCTGGNYADGYEHVLHSDGGDVEGN